MQTLLSASLSASGSPSEVKQRISDQVSAAGAKSPDQAAALGVARGFIEKAIAGVSEDDTLSVNADISISVTDAPPVVAAKVQAITDAAAASVRQSDAKTQAAETALAALRTELATTKAALEAAIAPPAPASGTPTAVGV